LICDHGQEFTEVEVNKDLVNHFYPPGAYSK
jgi:hypothetical protein